MTGFRDVVGVWTVEDVKNRSFMSGSYAHQTAYTLPLKKLAPTFACYFLRLSLI